MGDLGPVYDDFGVPMGEPLDLRRSPLRDALAAALLNNFGSHLTGTVAGIDAHDMSDAILSDPAFRAALTEAVAEACRAEWPSHREGTATYTVGFGQTTYGPEWTVLDPALPSSLDYAAIVARMLP